MILGGLCALAIAVIGAIVLAVFLVNRTSDENNLEEIKLEDILTGRLQPRRFDGTWVDGSSYYFVDQSTVSIFCALLKHLYLFNFITLFNAFLLVKLELTHR